VTFAIADLIDPENEEIPAAARIELFGATTRSPIVLRRTSADAEQFGHAWSESLGTVILAHAQATKCSKSLVK
jgi:hypothetical protein